LFHEILVQFSGTLVFFFLCICVCEKKTVLRKTMPKISDKENYKKVSGSNLRGLPQLGRRPENDKA
jgi:hypothetical protein